VVYRNGDVTLAGTVYLPLRRGAHPAVVFAHGSGPMDREADLFYADYLVRRGIVVLLYDKRGVGESTGEWRGATLEDLTSDAVAGVGLLRGRSEVDAYRVGVAGRSQGGQLALLAAARAPSVAFAVNISGAAVRPWQQMNYQAEAELRRDSVPEEATREALAFMDQKWAVAATGQGWDSLAAVVARARAARRPWLRYVQVPDKLEDIRESWETMNYDPDQTLAAVRQPVLGLFGERDVSTPVRETVAAMRRGLARAGNREVTIRVFPRADHALLVWAGGGPDLVLPRYPAGYPEVIARWIQERARHHPSKRTR
jgi:pimeloyl-ACP methyl ester carboxylesterase